MGRNFFYVVVVSGKVNCVEFVVKYLIKLLKENLILIDINREILIDIVWWLNYSEMERLFYKHMYNEKGEWMECNFVEFGIDLSEESELEDFVEEKNWLRGNIFVCEG